MKFFMGLCIAISTMMIPTQERQKPEPRRQPVEGDREIVIQNLPDLSGDWHLYPASEKDIPSPNKRVDFRFKGVDKVTDADVAEENAGRSQYTVVALSSSGKEAVIHAARFDGQILLIGNRLLKKLQLRGELPGFEMNVVGDHFEGYMTHPDGARMGGLLKLVKSKRQSKDITM